MRFNRILRRCTVAAGLLLAAAALAAAPPPPREPAIPAEWLTPAEREKFEATPSYDETLAFLRRLEQREPAIHLEFFGTSAAGRPLPVVIVAKERSFTPVAAAKSGRPVVMIQNGIHAGEIDGKDAALMLLRDLALGLRPGLLDSATLVIVPIYNVDGHERVSPWNRPNQDGPVRGMGFRTTADGADLNRDYLKATTPETRALLGLLNAWRPHLFVDVHVTNGCDHDWVLTWAAPEAPQLAVEPDAWMQEHLPRALGLIAALGHRNGPYVDLVDSRDPARGFSSWVGEPRFSTGYLPLRNRPVVLIETHSHKPYERRVRAVRDFLAALLAEVGADGDGLRRAVAAAEARTVAQGAPTAAPSTAALTYVEAKEPDRLRFPIYDWTEEESAVSGRTFLRYHPGVVRELEVPWFHRVTVETKVARPRGYLVLPGWPEIEARLAAHGLRSERLTRPLLLPVESYRLRDPKPAERSYQGLTRLTATVERRREEREIPAGAIWVSADQPDFEVAVQLFEPEAPDSLVQWGLLSRLFEMKEWIDPGVLEDEAQRQLADPAVAAAWQAALANAEFARDARARSFWWYQRTRWFDEQWGLLPIFRLVGPLPAAH